MFGDSMWVCIVCGFDVLGYVFWIDECCYCCLFVVISSFVLRGF